MSITVLKILHVVDFTTAFSINNQNFYIKIGIDLPELYNSKLKRIITPNIDYWFQAQTQRLYDLKSFKHMSVAFADGQKSVGKVNNISSIVMAAYIESKEMIFRSKHTRYFAQQYKLELLSITQAQKLIANVSVQFDKLQETMSTQQLHLYLCRLYWYCAYHMPDQVPVIENMIARLGLEPASVNPNVSDIDNNIASQIELTVLKSIDVSESDEKLNIIKNTIVINNSVLFRR